MILVTQNGRQYEFGLSRQEPLAGQSRVWHQTQANWNLPIFLSFWQHIEPLLVLNKFSTYSLKGKKMYSSIFVTESKEFNQTLLGILETHLYFKIFPCYYMYSKNHIRKESSCPTCYLPQHFDANLLHFLGSHKLATCKTETREAYFADIVI